MTRQADPKSTGYFSIKARNETEQQLIGDLKRLSRQDDIDLADLVFEGIQHMLKAHHWPPGNPQLQLAVFQQEKLPITETEKCKCGRPAIVYATDLRGITKIEQYFCQNCFSNVPCRYDPKIWKITLDRRNKK
ncbi:MAG: hypothetical protein LBC03_01560 [Nitrososphaerota archaeon]|nr:hypothetical protein [Nitrososphaerota archaeon]